LFPPVSQSPDEDSLSSDLGCLSFVTVPLSFRLNPLTRIHCLPTVVVVVVVVGLQVKSQSPDEDSLSSDNFNCSVRRRVGAESLNPLTRIHCLPTAAVRRVRTGCAQRSQSPDEDSLSSDALSALSSLPQRRPVSIP